eukprot:CAMPEP_0115223842 /NCGR_PEP_ID=MMETSP0270-20121206/29254_1 /TAXON_ID=71861 /ORGANISM="Scrippsiella trochoidea, Strain CCMP3099" /LENGTH=45 /DNA_ID= /DNA_START= /DNA_END= /DNA_ORIENTATION=
MVSTAMETPRWTSSSSLYGSPQSPKWVGAYTSEPSNDGYPKSMLA